MIDAALIVIAYVLSGLSFFGFMAFFIWLFSAWAADLRDGESEDLRT